MFKKVYSSMNGQIHPNEELAEKIIHSSQSHKRNRRKITYRRFILAISVITIFLGITPTLAANVPRVYDLMYLVSPTVAQFFMPVQKSYEDNGIKMEVVSAYIHDNIAEIYITMEDLIGDRIDATTDLYDSYSINRPSGSSAYCMNIGYDEETKKATFLVSITELENKKIVGDKITLSVKEFLSHKKNFKDVKIPLDLSLITTAKDTQSVYSFGGGGIDYEKYVEGDEVTVLAPYEPMSGFPIEGIDLTAIGYIDDILHIQIAVYNPLENDNHGFFYLKDKDGNTKECIYNVYFKNQGENIKSIEYVEYGFDVPKEEIGNYSLYGDFVISGMKTEGNWHVTFPLEEIKKDK